MEPVAILDKSAFQSLSRRECLWLNHYFRLNVIPILVHEIVGDLTKEFRNGDDSRRKAAEYADKFGGSGSPSNVSFRKLALSNLLGDEVKMDGRIPVDSWERAHHPAYGPWA